MNELNINAIFLSVIIALSLVVTAVKNIVLHKQNSNLKVAVLILSYNLELYNALYGVIDKKDIDKANFIITQARRKEEASGRNPE